VDRDGGPSTPVDITPPDAAVAPRSSCGAAGCKYGADVPRWITRDYHDDDLEAVVSLWESTSVLGQASVFTVSECIGALRSHEPAVVAVSGGEVVGVALATISGDRAWVTRIAVHPERRRQGVSAGLLSSLERRVLDRGVRRLAYVLPEGDGFSVGLAKAGYTRTPAVAYYEKVEPVGPGEAHLLDALGGRVLPDGLWEQIAGMQTEKTLIERRVVLPLREPERAQAHGVLPPRAIVLFGPPGTGKTTFARGIASRLGWPFVEIFPSRLAAGDGGLANALREVFAQLADLERVVLFMDEVEEIAPIREGAPTSEVHGVTNELLKLIPAFRERDTRLLVAATNSIRSMDSAFLRPGRFDYLLPIGPPDSTARAALWGRFVASSELQDVDIDALVGVTEGFTPADIEHVARVAAQAAFERDVVHGEPTEVPGATTEDYLSAIAQVRPTVTAAMRAEFAEDIEAFART
jgi:AAA+ superfamily predicted ATPase/GNAT superfamily N-acetyltransferase